MAHQPLLVVQYQIHFYTYKQLYFKQFSSAEVRSLNIKKQFYFKLFNLVNKVKWFQVLLCINNNPIKRKSFIYAQLNVKNSSISNHSALHMYSLVWFDP